MIETVTLSFVNIILSSYELYKLADYLLYTTEKNKTLRVHSAFEGGYDSEDEPHSMDRQGREKTMRHLIQQVKHNREANLNGRLDELVNEFANRKYKSCIIFDMHLQQEIVEDPRKTITWPLTPVEAQHFKGQHYKFTLDDRYGLQDNCYYESVLPVPVKDKNLGGDAGEIEFNAQLDRK